MGLGDDHDTSGRSILLIGWPTRLARAGAWQRSLGLLEVLPLALDDSFFGLLGLALCESEAKRCVVTRLIARREVLAGASSFALGLTASCTSKSRRIVEPNSRVGIGLIGVGIRGSKLLLRGLLGDTRVQVLAVCDVDSKRREHFRELVDRRHGHTRSCASFNDYRDLLQRPDIDAVLIATPDHWHATQAIAAARAGKDVYCEKPLTHTLREGEELIRAVRETGCVFQTGSQQRSEFAHRFVRAVELVRNGSIGDVLGASVGVGDPPKPCDLGAEAVEPGLDWERWLGPAPYRDYHSELSPRGLIRHYPRWRRYTEYSGGYLADMGAHHFDIVQWALGADEAGPIAVEAPPVEGAVRGAALLYANGVRVVHGGPAGVTFHGSKGLLHVDRGRLSGIPQRVIEAPSSKGGLRIDRRRSHLDDWIASILERATPACSAQIGARSAAVCQLLNLAYEHRVDFSWDPHTWRFGHGGRDVWRDYQRRAGFPLT